MMTWVRNGCVVGMFVLCAGWGIWMSARCQSRAQMLAALGGLLADMRQAMVLQGLTPGQWAGQYKGSLKLPALLSQGMQAGPEQPLASQWEEAVRQFVQSDAMAATLSAEDVTFLLKLGDGLEAGHPAGLDEHLSFYTGELKRRSSEAGQDAARKRGMYLRVGMLTGLGCVILMI